MPILAEGTSQEWWGELVERDNYQGGCSTGSGNAVHETFQNGINKIIERKKSDF